jgi:hypothetical protein
MKTMLALAVVLLTLVPHSAYALTITQGTIRHNQSSAPLALFGGNGFSVQASEPPSHDEFLFPAFGVDPFAWTMSLGSAAIIQVGSETCRAAEGTVPGCGGLLTLTSPGFAMPTDWPPGMLFVGTVPFAAHGFLIVGGTQYDLFGEGMVTGTRCLDLSQCGIVANPGAPQQFLIGATLTYTFTVPEAPTLLLTALSALTIVGMALVQKRAASATRMRRPPDFSSTCRRV